jgi:hypothetical protein
MIDCLCVGSLYKEVLCLLWNLFAVYLQDHHLHMIFRAAVITIVMTSIMLCFYV